MLAKNYKMGPPGLYGSMDPCVPQSPLSPVLRVCPLSSESKSLLCPLPSVLCPLSSVLSPLSSLLSPLSSLLSPLSYLLSYISHSLFPGCTSPACLNTPNSLILSPGPLLRRSNHKCKICEQLVRI